MARPIWSGTISFGQIDDIPYPGFEECFVNGVSKVILAAADAAADHEQRRRARRARRDPAPGCYTIAGGPAQSHIASATADIRRTCAAYRSSTARRPRVVSVLAVGVTDDDIGAGASSRSVLRRRHCPRTGRCRRDRLAGPGDVTIMADDATAPQRSRRLPNPETSDLGAAGKFATGDHAARTRALLRDLATGSRH
jgi:hypothetical protein